MKVERFLSEFAAKGWHMPLIYERLYEFIDEPEQVFDFCRGFMVQADKSTTFFQDALSFLKREDLQKLVALAFANRERMAPAVVQDIVSRTALQAPDLLHPYLSVIFDEKINFTAYSMGWPWRNAPEHVLALFQNRLVNSRDREEQRELMHCLLETRHLPTLYFLQTFNQEHQLTDDFTDCLERVGFTVRNGEICSYCPSTLYHCVFPSRYWLPHSAVFLNSRKHPTWRLPAGAGRHRMGGVIGADGGNPLLHLLTLDPVPEGVRISLDKITFAVHIREINEGYGAVFYRHDGEGNPERIGEASEVETEGDQPFVPCLIALANTPQRWQYQDWGAANSRENLFRLGGEPSWIQGGDVLTCPLSGEKMDFVFQLGSGLPDIAGAELMFGSGGTLYAFWCDQTRVSGYIAQWT